MIFPPKLLELHIMGARAHQSHVVAQLQRLGALHITDATLSHERLKNEGSQSEADIVSKLLLDLRYIAEQTGTDIHGTPTALPELRAVIERAKAFSKKYLSRVRQLTDRNKQLTSHRERLEAQTALLAELPIDITMQRTRELTTEVYRSEKPVTLRVSKARITEVRSGKTHYYTITVPRSNMEKLEAAVQGTPLKRIDLSFVETSTDTEENRISQQLTAIRKEQEANKRDLASIMADERSTLRHLIMDLDNHHAQQTITNRFQRSSTLFVLKGHCTKKGLSRIRRELPDVQIDAQPARQDAPTKLENGPLSKHFQKITELFSVPRYGAIDPTRLLTLFYPLFFGFMLGDVGYGLLLGAITLAIMYKGSPNLKPLVPILLLSTVSTIVFGLVFGSVFGGLVPITPLYADSFSAAFSILIISLVVGLVHMNLGAVLRIIQSTREGKKVWTITKEAGPLIILEAAVALAVFKLWIPAGVLGAALLALVIARGGFLGIMDITGYFGTWFSYARLLALSLATAGVALAVNTMAQQVHAFGRVGVVLWLLILVGGHLFNFVINLIGAGINAARLNYVEFFGLFFEGGGTRFEPFRLTHNQRR